MTFGSTRDKFAPLNTRKRTGLFSRKKRILLSFCKRVCLPFFCFFVFVDGGSKFYTVTFIWLKSPFDLYSVSEKLFSQVSRIPFPLCIEYISRCGRISRFPCRKKIVRWFYHISIVIKKLKNTVSHRLIIFRLLYCMKELGVSYSSLKMVHVIHFYT